MSSFTLYWLCRVTFDYNCRIFGNSGDILIVVVKMTAHWDAHPIAPHGPGSGRGEIEVLGGGSVVGARGLLKGVWGGNRV